MKAISTHLPQRVQCTIQKYGMLEPRQRVLAAVSGGADSVCLLAVLRELQYPVEVAHLDHQTREGESRIDAGFVRELCAQFNVPLHMESRPVIEEARKRGRNFEDYARQARYDLFARLAADCGGVVATGHTFDDQAETVLMRLLRGASPRGAAGIPPVGQWRVAGSDAPVKTIRPLIECTRGDILDYLEAQRLPFRSDISNWDRRFVRNRVRHELLPLLERDYNPEVRGAIVRFAELLRTDNLLLDRLAEAAAANCIRGEALNRNAFSNLDETLRRRVLAAFARRVTEEEIPFARLNAGVEFITSGATGNRFDLGGGIQLQNGREETYLLGAESPEPPRECVPLRVPGQTHAYGRTFFARLFDFPPADNPAAYCNAGRQIFDADRAGTELTVRTRRTGDRISPLGMGGSKSLGDYFTDAGIPQPARDAQLLVTNGETVLWVVGYAVGEQAAVTASTQRWLVLEVIHGTEHEAAA